MQREKDEREARKRERDAARKAKFVDPLTRACPTCGAVIGDVCIVIAKGFAGRGEPRATNRVRKPHPERARAGASA